MVSALGGPAAFYQAFYLGSVYPLVLLRQGLNYNYYDSPALIKSLWPDMRLCLQQQVRDLGLRGGSREGNLKCDRQGGQRDAQSHRKTPKC